MLNLKNLFLILALSVAFNSNLLFGQSEIKTIIEHGYSLFKNRDYNNAISEFNQALIIIEKEKIWEESLASLIGFAYSNHALRNYKASAQTIDRFLPILLEKGLDKSLDFAKLMLLRGVANRWLGDFTKSLDSYEKSLTIYVKSNYNHDNVAFAYRNAALIYLRRLDYPKTIEYLEKGLESDSTQKYNASINGYLCSTYTFLGNYDEALYYFEKGMEQNPKSKFIKSDLLSYGASACVNKGDLKKGKELLMESMSLIKNVKGEESNTLRNYLSFAEIELKEANYKLVEFNIKEALKIAPDVFDEKSREGSKMHVMMGELYFHLQKIDSALTHYQQALIQVFPNFNSTNIADNPSVEDIYTESWIMTASARKAEALRARYDLNKDIADLENAAECFDLSIAGIKSLTNSYGTDKAKLYLGDYTHNYFEEAIEVNYLLWQATYDQKYLEKIFSIIERSKANVLAEAIQKNRGLILAGIPDSLLEREQNLRLELADLNKSIKLEELLENDADTEMIADLRSRMTSRQREYEQLLADLKIDYPQFKSYVEEPVTPTIAEVQRYLKPRGETMMEYFEGDKYIYLMQITDSSSSIQQIPHSDFWNDQIGDFQDYFRNSSAIINDPTGFFSVAENLYRQVFPFDSLGVKLIIVPDGALNFIPFEALVKEQPSEPVFSKVAFLLFHHQIRYAYSAGLLLTPTVHLKPNINLLRISPLFANGERGLVPLLTGNEPIAAVPHLQTLHGDAATLSAFRSQAANCQLLQLSTHAGADENDIAPRIEFIDQALYLPELYAMKIPAELVVLSSCETGLGKFEKGEGVMSLARGFAYAGANDLVASLWKVNESSTSDLIQYFYENIKVGQTKSAALRNAKLQYLQEAKSDVKLSPYYWAGFVSIGHDLPMDINQKSNPWWLLLAIAMMVTVFIYWKNKTR